MPRRPRKRRPSNDPLEHTIQSRLVGLLPPLLKPGIVMMAIPNGGLRHPIVAKQLKSEGLLPGSPDLVFAKHKGLVSWLEMKKKGGRLSDEQLGIKAKLERLEHSWGTANSVDTALEELDRLGVLRPDWRNLYMTNSGV